jgi:hypothetical protein
MNVAMYAYILLYCRQKRKHSFQLNVMVSCWISIWDYSRNLFSKIYLSSFLEPHVPIEEEQFNTEGSEYAIYRG